MEIDEHPDILLSLGGESFTVYTIQSGFIKNIITSSKCAAGTGEFIVQQFGRMGFSLQEGLDSCEKGSPVKLATRCSVHCKSDATHKLNKGECSPQDIARSLVDDLAAKVVKMIELARWPFETILITGGLSLNQPFLDDLNGLLSDSKIVTVPQSPYFEAYGASLLAAEVVPIKGEHPPLHVQESTSAFDRLPPILQAESLLDYRVETGDDSVPSPKPDSSYILGLDAGSTTTKAVLFEVETGTIAASCYLRTEGNPVEATRQCILNLRAQLGAQKINIIQSAATGSGREVVSVYLNGSPAFNEILAHARAAVEEVPDVDTVFEIGGQDSKFISLLSGLPVDYVMNEGCSAGTGSFLEESAATDMNVHFKEISQRALLGEHPIAFGERCAAFINTDLRNALQQGARHDDVLAGLAYAIADNYISRIVGSRSLGKTIFFQGGVALNKAVAMAIASRTGKNVVVPPRPELMGSIGAALMVKDLIDRGKIEEIAFTLERTRVSKTPRPPDMETLDSFTCKSCDNFCEIKKIRVRDKIYPFGGLCSKYWLERSAKKNARNGRDLIALRNEIMFSDYRFNSPDHSKGTIGVPMSMSSYELFPFLTTLITELGFEPLMSKPSRIGNNKTLAPICYPGEIAHGAVYDLLEQNADFVLVPDLVALKTNNGFPQSFMCTTTSTLSGIVKSAFENQSDKILSPLIGLSEDLLGATGREIIQMAQLLGVGKSRALAAFEKALATQHRFAQTLAEKLGSALKELDGEPTVVLAGRPYTVMPKEVNIAIPRKITSRGFHVIPMDALVPTERSSHPRNCWYYTQQLMNAVGHIKRSDNLYLCLISCFSCGPDAVIFHEVSKELEGRPFCYLEIDSHTAHAGIETRIEAFLEIIKGQRDE